MSVSAGPSRLSASSDVSLSESGHRRSAHNPQHALNLDVGLVIGRDQEKLVLEQAYERVCCRVQQAPSEMVLVEGASGTGKTALVSSLRESIDREDMGMFAYGKYDLQSSTPHEAIVDAATELCNTVSDSEYYLEDVKEHFQTVLSNVDDKRLLLTLVPAVGVLLELQESEEIEDHAETETDQMASNPSHAFALKQLMQVICKFLNAVASVHPVVLFLDDLHFADASAKELLTALVSDMSSANLLVVGAFRKAEFDWDFDSAPSESPQWRISRISLGPLSQTHVNEIVSRATNRQPEETKSLSEAVYGKTGGNALFLVQFLDMLHSAGLLFFNFQRNQWDWKTDLTAHTDVSDNIAELLIQKLKRLSTSTQTVLMLAACLGHSFDYGALETLFLSSEDLRLHVGSTDPGSEKQDFRGAIFHAVELGLIERVSDNRFKFSHDAIQQAAFSMCPPDTDEDVFHSGLGECVLSLSQTESGEDWMLFSAANLLTRRSSTVEASNLSRVTLAQLCLEAGRKALGKSAFVTAARYSDRGYSLLDMSERWTSQYALSLDLLTLSTEMHYACGDHESALNAAAEVISHARTFSDKHSAQIVAISVRLAQWNFQEVVRLCLVMLKGYEIVFPKEPKRIHVLLSWLKVRRLLNGREASDFLQLPRANDGKMTRSSHFLHTLANSAWLSGKKELAQLSCLLMMRLTLIHGISMYSACSLAAYGVLLSHFGKLRDAYEYGRLALEMERKFGNKLTMSRTFVSVLPFLVHLREPVHACLEPLKVAYENGMEVGDVTYAARSLVWRVVLGLYGGMRLDHLEIQTREYCDFFRHHHLETSLANTLPTYQLVLNLLGKSRDPLVLSGEAISDEAEFIKYHRGAGNTPCLVQTQNARVILLVLLDELELADAERRNPPSEYPGTYHSKFCNLLFSGLICLGLAKRRNKAGQGLQSLGYRIHAQKYRKRLNKLVQNGSVNCVPFVKLLDAETSSLRSGLSEESVKLYHDAIAASGRCGFRLCTGLAYEKAGEYLLERGDCSRATNFLQCARDEFADFGAHEKLSQMDRKYGDKIPFQKMDEAFPSRPSSLTTPHSIRWTMSSHSREAKRTEKL